jgi:hypothetical protein
MMRTLLFTAVVLIVAALPAGAQVSGHWCQTHQRYEEAYKEDPDAFKAIERQLDEAVVEYASQLGKVDDGRTFYIPVVFHYFHPTTEGNYTSFFGEDAANAVIQRINDDMNRNNADSNDIQPYYATFRRGNARIKLIRAQLDPDGNPTTGINYISTDLTYNRNRNTDNEIKYMSYWPSTKYLNFWIVKELEGEEGILAHATLPEYSASGSTRMSEDGVMGLLDVFRQNIGDRFYRHALSHETGHWLGLRHPFQGDNSVLNSDGTSSGCSTVDCRFGGDKICDIPQVKEIIRTCVRNEMTCPNENRIDNLTNIMDYRYCPAMFSKGQVTRMRGTLVSFRSELVSYENLLRTGIGTSAVADIGEKVEVYPNPFFDKIIVEVESQNETTSCIEIRDLLGREAYRDCKKKLLQGQNRFEIDASEMNMGAEGIYLLQIRTPDATITRRIHYKPMN